ncbi:MAG: hypothetical protein ACRDVM_07635 [Acidimicrobiia bacterium]
MRRPTECEWRFGVLALLAIGALVLGFPQVAAAFGVFAAVQGLNLVAERRSCRVPRRPHGDEPEILPPSPPGETSPQGDNKQRRRQPGTLATPPGETSPQGDKGGRPRPGAAP